MVVGKLKIQMEKLKLNLYLTLLIKINSKWIKNLNVRHETVKLLEGNIGENLLDIGLGNDYLDMTPKTKTTNMKIKTWDYIKLKTFYTAKDTINKMKRQHMEWEKIFTNHISDQGLIAKIYKECIELNSKTSNSLIKIWAKDLNRYFSKEGKQMVNRCMKKCSASLIIREMQIKTTMRYHLRPVRMTVIKKTIRASPDGLVASSAWATQVWFLGAKLHCLSVNSYAVPATHIKELEGLMTGIYNYVLGLWRGKKREEGWKQMLAQGESFPAKKKERKREMLPSPWATSLNKKATIASTGKDVEKREHPRGQPCGQVVKVLGAPLRQPGVSSFGC
uniref:Uncharacterized protein n=1 Tax=Equus asinus asinus TaxID=83772 RepID=A0A8C4M983_EQUAS